MDDTSVASSYSSMDSGTGQINGSFRGRVEDNRDPLQLGRVRVRVPKYDGTSGDGKDNRPVNTNTTPPSSNSDETPTVNPSTKSSEDDPNASKDNRSDTAVDTNGLSWAYPKSPSGAGWNHGSIMVPDIGDTVFVEYEDGDRSRMIYSGGCWGRGADQEKPMGALNPDKGGDPLLYGGKGGLQPINLIRELPEEVYYRGTNSPTGKVIYKSPKGATIWIQECDEKECLNIVDRLGQAIRMYSPVKKDLNEHNALNRGGAYAPHFSNLKPHHCIDNTSTIEIMDSMNQSIKFTAKDYKAEGEYVHVERYGADSSIEIKDATDQSILLQAKNFMTTDEKGLKGLNGRDSSVVLTDASGQVVKMTAKDDKGKPHKTEEEIDVATAGSKIELISADKGTFIRLSNEKIELVAGKVTLTLDKNANTITLNSGAGSTMTMAGNHTSIQAGRIDLN